MTCWIEPDLDSTQELLSQVLSVVNQGDRVQFYVPSGMAESIAQRLRVMISRSRKRLRQRGVKPKMFVLRTESYKATKLDGTRHECLVLWTEVRSHDNMTQDLEDLLKNDQLS